MFQGATSSKVINGMDRLSMALFDAAVDLNPHQIEAHVQREGGITWDFSTCNRGGGYE